MEWNRTKYFTRYSFWYSFGQTERNVSTRSLDLPEIFIIATSNNHDYFKDIEPKTASTQFRFLWRLEFKTNSCMLKLTMFMCNWLLCFAFQVSARNPLFLPYMSDSPGFTAIILSYNRIDSLFELINMISKAPSVQKIIVVWNNQYKSLPHCKYFNKYLLKIIL